MFFLGIYYALKAISLLMYLLMAVFSRSTIKDAVRLSPAHCNDEAMGSGFKNFHVTAVKLTVQTL